MKIIGCSFFVFLTKFCRTKITANKINALKLKRSDSAPLAMKAAGWIRQSEKMLMQAEAINAEEHGLIP